MDTRRLRSSILFLAFVLAMCGTHQPPVWAQNNGPAGITWYLPMDKQPVCVGQKVVIRGGYNTQPSDLLAPLVPEDPLAPLVPQEPDPLAPLVPDPPDPLAPLVSTEIHNQTDLGNVSPKKINAAEEAGFFTFVFTATKAGTATIRSEIPGVTSPAVMTLRVTQRCKYIYGLRIDFTIDVDYKGEVVGDYFMWAGGYLKEDPNDPSRLSNDPQDRIALGGQLLNFSVGECQQTNLPLSPRTAKIKATAFFDEDEPVIHIRFQKELFQASGAWWLICKGKRVQTGDVFAGFMMMMDPPLNSEQPWATATCPLEGGACDVVIPSVSFMKTIVVQGSQGAAAMPFFATLKLEKVQ
jgi:hypothetical protein